MHEASCLRDISGGEKRVRYIIQRRRDWGRRMAATMGGKQPGSWHWNNLEITDQDEDNLINMLHFLQSISMDYRKAISGNWMYFYSADSALIDSVEALPFLEHRERIVRRRVELEGNPGTVVLQQAKHRYRSYFRGYMKLTSQQNHALQKYLLGQPDIRMGPALAIWVQEPEKYYIGDYFFIDHDDMGIVTMLSLIVPKIIRRTKPIETAK